MTEIQLLATLALATVFAVSGVMKLRDLPGTAEAIRGFGVTRPAWARGLAVLVPVAELLLVVGLLVASGRLFLGVSLAAVAALTGFTVLVGHALRSGRTTACHCFGELSDAPMSLMTLGRNVMLLAAAALVAVQGRGFGGFLPVLVSRSGWAVAWIVTTWLAGLAVVVLGTRWRAVQRDAGQHAGQQAGQGAAAIPVHSSGAAAADEPGLAVPIPDVTVFGRDGLALDLRSLPDRKSVLVVGIAPGCQSCAALTPLLPSLREQIGKEVSLAVLSWSEWAPAAVAYPELADALYADPDGKAFAALSMAGTPSAVLLGTDGQVVAGPALGGEGVMELVSAIVQAIGVNIVTGVAHQVQEPRPVGGDDTGADHLPEPGTVVDEFLVETEDGRRVTFAEALAGLDPCDPAVVAWRSSCTFCAEVAAELEQFSARGEVLLVVSEDISQIRAQGLTGPVVRTVDPEVTSAMALRLPGTPAGYPVGRAADRADALVVGAGGGVGGGSILRMLSERAQTLGSYVPTPLLTQMEALHAHARGEHNHAEHDNHAEHNNHARHDNHLNPGPVEIVLL